MGSGSSMRLKEHLLSRLPGPVSSSRAFILEATMSIGISPGRASNRWSPSCVGIPSLLVHSPLLGDSLHVRSYSF